MPRAPSSPPSNAQAFLDKQTSTEQTVSTETCYVCTNEILSQPTTCDVCQGSSHLQCVVISDNEVGATYISCVGNA
ncbi:hypothetical protein DPMN_086626 [Dreissena polymorpha]|uniref:Uncharacterized protein n=1 Tax=Dreissena polymorpha TaxID=45954 RepID=A0A9D4KRJ5_DREPO|nr:hypothetical protein DPMN_086626 [Dreissena polymorpha]